MTNEEMTTKACPFRAGNCQGKDCMAAKTEGFNLRGNWRCSLIPLDTTPANNMTPQIPGDYVIREIKS